MADKRKKQPKLKLSTALFKGSFIHNPVLTQFIGICPIVAAATTVKNGFTLFVITAFLLVVTEALTSLLLRKVSRWLRIALYTLISCFCVAVFASVFSLASEGLGIYLYLLAVNALIVIRCEKFACRTSLRNSIVDAVACSVGFGAVSLIVGAVREFITYGTILAKADMSPRLTAGAMPFAALVILGFLAAIHKAFILKFHPTEETDTFSLHSVNEKTEFRDSGIGHKPKKKTKKAKNQDEDNFDYIRPRYSIEDVLIDSEEKEDSDV